MSCPSLPERRHWHHPRHKHKHKVGRKLLCRGGMARKPICPTPPSPSLVAVPGGGFGLGRPYLPCRGGGVRPQHTWLKMIPTSR